VPQLPDGEHAIEAGGQPVAPHADQAQHQRAPSGQRMTRIVVSRISKSRKGV
jgi:hypothetical protein